MAKKRTRLEAAWEEVLRAEGLGLIEETATRRLEMHRIARARKTDSGVKVQDYERTQLYAAYCAYFWRHMEVDRRLSLGVEDDILLVLAWLYGCGWSYARIADVLGRDYRYVQTRLTSIYEQVMEEYLEECNEE